MSRTTFHFVAPLVALLAVGSLSAQTCVDYHKFNCQRSGDKRFSINGQSKSAAVQVGQATELNIIVYRGQDYRISLCSDSKILGENIGLRLVEKVREPRDVEETVTTVEAVLDSEGNPTGATKEVRSKRTKRVYEEVTKVIWDNTEHEMALEVEFSCTATKRIAIEVIAPGADASKQKRSDRQYDIGCAGILIEHMPTPGLGF
ncbi:MAG: hypothetical protein KF905_06710 [Flavobacteriales bacterium]|nr:hypothetical protein [Flavobacteriales bacterium]